MKVVSCSMMLNSCFTVIGARVPTEWAMIGYYSNFSSWSGAPHLFFSLAGENFNKTSHTSDKVIVAALLYSTDGLDTS